MTTALAVRPGARLGRTAAALAVASAALHLVLVDAGDLGSVAMLALAAVCLPCAWHLARRPSAAVWRTTALVDLGMLALHVQMTTGTTMPGMAHGPDPVARWALGLVVAQLALAGWALLGPRRAGSADMPGRDHGS